MDTQTHHFVGTWSQGFDRSTHATKPRLNSASRRGVMLRLEAPSEVEIARPDSPSARSLRISFALILRTVETALSTMWPSHGGRSQFCGTQAQFCWPPNSQIFSQHRRRNHRRIRLAAEGTGYVGISRSLTRYRKEQSSRQLSGMS